MKARVRIEEEEFRMFNKVKDDLMPQFMAIVLFSQHMRYKSNTDAYRKKKVKQLYEDVKALLEAPDIFGKPLTATGAIEFIKREYGIDLDNGVRAENLETFREYQRRMRE